MTKNLHAGVAALAAALLISGTSCEQRSTDAHETIERATAQSDSVGPTGQTGPPGSQARASNAAPGGSMGAPPTGAPGARPPTGSTGTPVTGAAVGSTDGGPPAAQKGPPVSDETIDTFLEATQKAQAVQSHFQTRLAEVQDPAEAKAMQQGALEAMRDEVESTGMKFDTYAQLSNRIQSDPTLLRRVQERIAQ